VAQRMKFAWSAASVLLIVVVTCGLGCGKQDRSVKELRKVAAMIKAAENSEASSHVTYDIWGRDENLLEACSLIRKGDHVKSSSTSSTNLDPYLPSNRKLLKAFTSRMGPVVEREDEWRKKKHFADVAARSGKMVDLGRFVVCRVDFPPGELDAGPVKVTEGFYRSTYQWAWTTCETADGHWTVAFSANLRECDKKLAGLSSTNEATQVRIVKQAEEINDSVRNWIHESPELLVAAPWLSFVFESKAP